MENYYITPSDKCFNELKEKAIEIWNRYDNTFGYVDEKVNQIKDIQNIRDNFMYIVSMFDIHNIRKLASILSKETLVEVNKRMPYNI